MAQVRVINERESVAMLRLPGIPVNRIVAEVGWQRSGVRSAAQGLEQVVLQRVKVKR